MKSLIIFYSLEGNTKFVVNAIKEELNEDVEVVEIKPIKEVPTSGFRKYLWGGKQVMLKETPEIEPINLNFSNYDLIVFGTPVWAGRFAPVFNTFLEKNKIEGKNIGLFCCHGGGGESKTFINFKEQLKNNNFVGEISFEEPLKKGKEENLIRAKEWIRNIKKSL